MFKKRNKITAQQQTIFINIYDYNDINTVDLTRNNDVIILRRWGEKVHNGERELKTQLF